MWERFSFYGMQGLLAYYIYYSATDGGLGMSEAVATSIVGAYGGLVYLSSVLGGWVADRILGSEKTVITSAAVVMIGHLALSLLPGGLGLGIGLVCIAVGSGSLTVTTSATLGDLYDLKDNRRDAAFSIYYMGVNIGGLIGPLLTSADRKSTRLNSSHVAISYAVFCLNRKTRLFIENTARREADRRR